MNYADVALQAVKLAVQKKKRVDEARRLAAENVPSLKGSKVYP